MAIVAGEPTEPVEAYAARHSRWNLTVLLMDSASFFFGVAVFDAGAVVPVLLHRMEAVPALIGVTYLIQVLGFTLPAMLAAHYIHGRANHKRFLLTTGGIGRALIFTLPFGLVLTGHAHKTLGIVWLLCAVGGFWFLDGCCAVSWTDIVAKCIVPRRRGLFFGILQMLGGLAAITAGSVVYYVFKRSSLTFPADYAVLAAFWAAGGLGSFLSLSLIREPRGAEIKEEDKPGFLQFVGEAVRLFRRNACVRTLIVSRWLLGANGLAIPFYAVYAQTLGVPEAMVGIYIIARSVGRILAGPIWGLMSHRKGPAQAVRWVSIVVAFAPALALFVFRSNALLISMVFFLQGITDDGLWTSCQNALYESVSDQDRPLAVGAVTVALTPVALYGVAGGAIVQFASYKLAFGLACSLGLCGALVAWRLPYMVKARGTA